MERTKTLSNVYRVTLDFGDFDAESEDEAKEAAAETFIEQPHDMAMMMKVSKVVPDGLCRLCEQPMGDSPFEYHEVCPSPRVSRP